MTRWLCILALLGLPLTGCGDDEDERSTETPTPETEAPAETPSEAETEAPRPAQTAALQDTATGLRSTVTELHPQVLAQLGLTAAVRELLRQFQSRNDIDVIAELDEIGKPQSQTLLYRAARELLTNVAKHAGATTVWVSLHRDGDRVVLTVRDDGAGFDPAVVGASVAQGHIGLGSLLARFDAMGGSMHVDAGAGRGTRVTATSPPEPESHGDG